MPIIEGARRAGVRQAVIDRRCPNCWTRARPILQSWPRRCGRRSPLRPVTKPNPRFPDEPLPSVDSRGGLFHDAVLGRDHRRAAGGVSVVLGPAARGQAPASRAGRRGLNLAGHDALLFKLPCCWATAGPPGFCGAACACRWPPRPGWPWPRWSAASCRRCREGQRTGIDGILLTLTFTTLPAMILLFSSGPLMHGWLRRRGQPVPYHLYAYSTAGGLAAVVAVPVHQSSGRSACRTRWSSGAACCGFWLT